MTHDGTHQLFVPRVTPIYDLCTREHKFTFPLLVVKPRAFLLSFQVRSPLSFSFPLSSYPFAVSPMSRFILTDLQSLLQTSPSSRLKR